MQDQEGARASRRKLGRFKFIIGITKVLKVEATNVGRYRNLVPGGRRMERGRWISWRLINSLRCVGGGIERVR